MLLKIENLHVKYGNIEALHGINIEVHEGEIISILGANGAGKSTTLLTISGLLRPSEGAIFFQDDSLHKLKAHQIVAAGIAHIPEGRRIFGTLSVQENLNLGAFVSTDQQQLRKNQDWIYELFPILKERRHQLAGTLSGGEQQMLAIGRGLMSSPKILLLDEPSLGLAPILVKVIFQTLQQINQAGVTLVLVEQNARMALKIAHRGYVLEVGNIVLHDTASALLTNKDIQNAYLGGA
ncbi:MAG: ABC transporter ATP-binding protein [Candidatus Vecturithrix sp.]|jgi:branched-chain amino acid transport system ATP-binding protein|nr:ABC transporter ATP-binding protein [Candidatus Vecturithrix sp.]